VRVFVISALLATSGFAWVVSGFSRTTPQSQQPTFRTGTNLVQVDAVVADGSGRPVTDLTAADFEVADDGAPVPVTAFRFISAAAAEGWHSDVISPIRNEDDETREAAIEGVRVVAIFLDEYHVQWENALRAVPALVQFVRTLPPADLLGVYGVMDSTRDVRFTRDREPAIAKIQAFQGRFNQFTPPKYPVEEEHLRHPQQIPQIRMQISSSTVEAIVTHLGAISERRKSLIVLSEKLDYGLSGGGALSQMSDRAMFVSELVGIANRFNVSLYPFDPGGLRVQGSRGQMGMSTIDMFRSLADDTGGRAIVNRNEFGPALQQVSSDAAAYYLLGFVSSHPSDGKYHKIAIRVKRRGVTLRARRLSVAQARGSPHRECGGRSAAGGDEGAVADGRSVAPVGQRARPAEARVRNRGRREIVGLGSGAARRDAGDHDPARHAAGARGPSRIRTYAADRRSRGGRGRSAAGGDRVPAQPHGSGTHKAARDDGQRRGGGDDRAGECRRRGLRHPVHRRTRRRPDRTVRSAEGAAIIEVWVPRSGPRSD